MFYDDHNPPHFHVEYEDFKGVFTVSDLKQIEGRLPRRVVLMVLEWAFQYRDALSENWEHAQNNEPLEKIPPLK
jgi:hypothetical protein